MSNLDSDPAGLIPQIFLIVALTAINAFFASAEMAIVSVNKSKINNLSKQGDIKAKLLERLIEEPSNFLSTIQIGITLAGFFSSASAATGISIYINDMLSTLNIPYTNEISMIGVTLLLSYFTLVFGELVPKRIALKKAEKIALSSVKIIYYISILAKPFIKILSFSTSLILKITKNDSEDIEEKVSEEEIRTLIAKSQQDGCIEDDEKKMLYGVFEFNDKVCKEIMTSSKDTFLIDINDDVNNTLDKILSLGYSRIPVYEGNIDNIVGVLYMKDLLIESKKVGFENINMKNIIQEPYFVPENKKTNELFKILKEKKIHLALLVDEYGGFSGIVTMEDLIEEIVGDIDDEYDIEESEISKIDKNTYIAKGILPISEVKRNFNENIVNGDYDTLNGYLITHMGEVPKEKKEITIDNIKYEILKLGNRRIEEIKITILR
ncbi:HlyC/CorC family transporter [Romboutsia ilealis]|uniref:HlyC/CorC family transporter n=1 Tax=Romboutsia faecis TaxID=2764597 RepID=A0ABR7JJZ5_9FIRM|nr:hemolysin family protein [Romboutsia faecis]MBC5995235.1 HlyC/CorC family transporter [Romboutsia faecis]MRN24516.1 HlyC/CorC family transporter [Romboutsia ilealis]